LTSYRIIKIKHTFRKRAVQPITTEEGSILSHSTADHVNKHSTNKSNQDKNEQYDERRPEITLQSSTLQAPTLYDYDSLRDEYYNDLQKELYSNISFNYTQHDRFEGTIEDAIFDLKKKSRTKQDEMHFFQGLMRTVAIWLLICIVIGTAYACGFGKHKHRALLSSCL
jgi:hypothetical protein